MIVLHLLLAPVGSGEASRARICSSSMSESVGGVAMLSAAPLVDALIEWWKDRGLTRKSSCSAKLLVFGEPGFQKAAWAQNL